MPALVIQKKRTILNTLTSHSVQQETPKKRTEEEEEGIYLLQEEEGIYSLQEEEEGIYLLQEKEVKEEVFIYSVKFAIKRRLISGSNETVRVTL